MNKKYKVIIKMIALVCFLLALTFGYFVTHVFIDGAPLLETIKIYGMFCVIPLALLFYTSIKLATFCTLLFISGITITVCDYYDVFLRSDGMKAFQTLVGDYPVSNFYSRGEEFTDYIGWFRFDADSSAKNEIIKDLNLEQKGSWPLHGRFIWWDIDDLDKIKNYTSNYKNSLIQIQLAISDTSETCYMIISTD